MDSIMKIIWGSETWMPAMTGIVGSRSTETKANQI